MPRARRAPWRHYNLSSSACSVTAQTASQYTPRLRRHACHRCGSSRKLESGHARRRRLTTAVRPHRRTVVLGGVVGVPQPPAPRRFSSAGSAAGCGRDGGTAAAQGLRRLLQSQLAPELQRIKRVPLAHNPRRQAVFKKTAYGPWWSPPRLQRVGVQRIAFRKYRIHGNILSKEEVCTRTTTTMRCWHAMSPSP